MDKTENQIMEVAPDERRSCPDAQELEEMKNLLREYGEALNYVRDKSIVNVVFAARDHDRLANYLLSEWGYEIGPESAGEMAIRLLRGLKRITTQRKPRRPVGGGPC